MKIFKRGSMMQEHLKQASVEMQDSWKSTHAIFENILKWNAPNLNVIIKKRRTCIL
jgi:hypothetical protein